MTSLNGFFLDATVTFDNYSLDLLYFHTSSSYQYLVKRKNYGWQKFKGKIHTRKPYFQIIIIWPSSITKAFFHFLQNFTSNLHKSVLLSVLFIHEERCSDVQLVQISRNRQSTFQQTICCYFVEIQIYKTDKILVMFVFDDLLFHNSIRKSARLDRFFIT